MDNKVILSDGGPLTTRVKSFYINKEIQRAYNFLIYFSDSDSIFWKGDAVASFHAVSVEIPNYSFEKDFLEAGPIKKSFPLLKHDGFEFTIKFEEDKNATIQKLIRRLVNRNVDSLGYNRPYKETVLNELIVSIYTNDAWNIYKLYFKNCYFLRASTAQYDYSANGQIFYDITFNADHYDIIDYLELNNKDRT